MSNYLHGMCTGSIKKSFLTEQKNFNIDFLEDPNAHFKIYTSKSKLATWFMKFFFSNPVTIVANFKKQSVFINFKDIYSKLKEYGFTKADVKKAIKEDQLGDLFADFKTESISRRFNHSIDKKYIQECVKLVRDHGHEAIDLPLSSKNPLKLKLVGDFFYIKHGQDIVPFTEAYTRINHLALSQLGLNLEQVNKIQMFFKERIQTIRELFAKNHKPQVYHLPNIGTAQNPLLNQSRKITLLPSGQMFISTDKMIGKGSFKNVYKIYEVVQGKFFASYILNEPKSDEKDIYELLNTHDVQNMQALQGKKGIAKLKNIIPQPASGDRQHEVVMKLYEKGSLHSNLHRFLTLQDKIKACKQLADSIKSLHDGGLVHRDLKSANCLVYDSKKQGLKIVLNDFGSTTNIFDDEKLNVHVTTADVTSPEYAKAFRKKWLAKNHLKFVLKDLDARHMTETQRWQKELKEAKLALHNAEQQFIDANKEPSDIWSLGVLFYEIIYQQRPSWLQKVDWSHVDDPQDAFWDKLANVSFPVTLPQETRFSNLLRKMLCPVDQRASISEVLHELNQL